MTDLRTAAQQALEALEAMQSYAAAERKGLRICDEAIAALRAALAQQAEPIDTDCHAQGICQRSGYGIGQQAEPVQDQRCRAEPRSDGDFVCDCKIGECPGRSAKPAQEPAFHGFMSDDGTQVDVCFSPSAPRRDGTYATAYYTAPPQRRPLTEKEMYIVEEEARKNFRLAQAGPRGQMITYWDSLTPWLIRAVERAHGIKE